MLALRAEGIRSRADLPRNPTPLSRPAPDERCGKMAETKCALYCRVSTEKQAEDDKTSLEEQERVCREFAERQGWAVEKVYVDPGISGETIDERPAMRNLLIEAAGGKFGVVVAQHQDRLARGDDAFRQVGGVLKAAGVKFATPAGVLDLGMPADRFTFNIFAAVAAYENDRLKERMLGGKIARARRGVFAFNVEPYGYRWDTDTSRPVEDPEEIDVVREIYAMAADRRMTFREIAEALRAKRVPTRTQRRYRAARESGEKDPKARPPGRWHDSTVKGILTSTVYKGLWQTWPFNRGRADFTRQLIARLGLADDTEPRFAKAENVPPPAIDEDIWTRAQTARRDHRHKFTGRRVKRQFLLSGGMVQCECGSTMTAREPRPGCRYYGCNRALRARTADRCTVGYVSADALDGIVWAKVEELCSDPEAMQAVADETEREQAPRWRRELKGTEQELDGLGFERATVMAAFRKGEMPNAEYREHMDGIEWRRGELAAEKARLETILANAHGPEEAATRLGKVAELFGGKLPSLDLDGRRRVLRMLEVEVTVSAGGRVLVEWLGSAFLGDSSRYHPVTASNVRLCPAT